jgi:epoxyqueuosine reductase
VTDKPSTSLTAFVKQEAQRLGFDLVGIATPDSPQHLETYLSWLNAGLHGEMAYLDTERARRGRADPRALLPACRSILVLGMCYDKPAPPARRKTSSSGRVAAYAWGDDYHETLPELLEALVGSLEAQVGHPIAHLSYTDTGPVLERDLAQRAGLGWIGKNTCLIHPRLGSYFFLAEILLDVDLKPDDPFKSDHCGTCTRCIEACPTDCILPNRTLDARRCISYLTIELKGPIPASLRDSLGDWIFGCDICQQACPWNLRFASQHGNAAFAPRPQVASPYLSEELTLSAQDFNRKFKNSPVKRSKRRGYLRNAAVASGNSGDQALVPALTLALQGDPEPLVRLHAAWALGRLAGVTARQALEQSLPVEESGDVQAEILMALRAIDQGS